MSVMASSAVRLIFLEAYRFDAATSVIPVTKWTKAAAATSGTAVGEDWRSSRKLIFSAELWKQTGARVAHRLCERPLQARP